MGIELLILFIVATIVLFILSVLFMDQDAFISVCFTMLGMIFCVLSAYGFWDVDYFYSDGASGYMHSVNMGTPWSYVFFGVFFMFVLVFFKIGYNLLQDAFNTDGQIDYKKR